MTNGSASLHCPEKGATSGRPHRSPVKREKTIVQKLKWASFLRKKTVRPSGVNSAWVSYSPVEIVPGAKRAGSGRGLGEV